MTSDERRSMILDRLADHVLAEGLAASSLRPLARAAGTSDRMLLYYFRDKPELVAATLERVAERMTTHLTALAADRPLPPAEVEARLIGALFEDPFWPFMRLWLEVASLAAKGDETCRTVGERLARGFHAWGEAQLDAPTPEARRRDASRLLLLVDGMVFLKSVGLEDIGREGLQAGSGFD